MPTPFDCVTENAGTFEVAVAELKLRDVEGQIFAADLVIGATTPRLISDQKSSIVLVWIAPIIYSPWGRGLCLRHHAARAGFCPRRRCRSINSDNSHEVQNSSLARSTRAHDGTYIRPCDKNRIPGADELEGRWSPSCWLASSD